jgi:hypothetical protein
MLPGQQHERTGLSNDGAVLAAVNAACRAAEGVSVR